MEDLPKRSRTFCCVKGCNSRACTNSELSFHSFPSNNKTIPKPNYFGQVKYVNLRYQWIKALGITGELKDTWKVSSKHFKPDDFFTTGVKRTYLKGTAIPWLEKEDNLKRKRRSFDRERHNNVDVKILKRNKNIQGKDGQSNKENAGEMLNQIKTGGDETREQSPSQSLQADMSSDNDKNYQNLDNVNDFDISPLPVHKKIMVEVGTQTDSEFVGFIDEKMNYVHDQKQSTNLQAPVLEKREHTCELNFIDLIKSDKDLSTLTGIPNLSTLDDLVELADLVHANKRANNKLSTKERIIVTMIKLKQNVSYSFLGAIFKKCTSRTLINVVNSTIDILSIILEQAIIWPSKNEILKNMPHCFNEFRNVRAVIDCTEVAIQIPRKLCCQIMSFSFYKSRCTAKFMTAVTPGGLISFVSKIYGGRVSDSAIFRQSGLIDLCEAKDALMFDRGFLVDDLCEERDVTLIRPPFLKDKIRYTKKESLENSSIACARVHVERLNQRIKELKVLGEKMPRALFGRCEKIFKIACGLVNLSAPIFKDDKFLCN